MTLFFFFVFFFFLFSCRHIIHHENAPTKNYTAYISGDDFSCVLYLKIPDLLKKENDSYEGRDKSGPGGIQFIYGEERIHCVTGVGLTPEEGDMLIFPANLRHVVNPFKSKCTRISMSANFKLQQTRRRK